MKKNNRRRSLVGAFLMLLILISGTFAFYQFNQGAFNPVRIEQRNLGRLHDDFEDRDGPGLLDKDVFAENFTAADMMVRVQFREFLSLNGEVLEGSGAYIGTNGTSNFVETTIEDHRTWPVVTFDGITYVPGSATDPSVPGMVVAERSEGISADIGAENIVWNLGNPDTVQKVFMPTHNQVSRTGVMVDPELTDGTLTPLLEETPFGVADLTNMARFSNTTGRAGEALAGGVFGNSLPGNGTWGLGADSIEEFFNGVQTGASIHDGTTDFWTPSTVFGAAVDTADLAAGSYYYAHVFYINADDEITISEEPVRHIAQPTLSVTVDSSIEGLYNGIITAADWIEADMPAGNFWIMDVDGWFYWNGYLLGTDSRTAAYNAEIPQTPLDERLPSTATSLLLNGISVPAHNDLSYIIHVDANWFNTAEMTQLFPTPSQEILEAFGAVSPEVPEDGVTVSLGAANVLAGEVNTLNVTVVYEGEVVEGEEFTVAFFDAEGDVIDVAPAAMGIAGSRTAISGTPLEFTPGWNLGARTSTVEIVVADYEGYVVFEGTFNVE